MSDVSEVQIVTANILYKLYVSMKLVDMSTEQSIEMCSFKSRMKTLHSEEISELGKLLLKIVFYFQPTNYLFH